MYDKVGRRRPTYVVSTFKWTRNHS
jgi:hypothetical protein